MDRSDVIEAPHMGMRLRWRDGGDAAGADALSFDLWMRADAEPFAMHLHPRQEERLTVVSGSALSNSGGEERVVGPGETVISQPGEPHTVGPAGGEDLEMSGELRPALSYKRFVERTFALDRAGHINAKGRGNPLRMAATGSREAEFYLAGPPVGLQRAILGAMERVAHLLRYDRIPENQL